MRRDWWKLLALVVPVLTGCLSHTRKLQQPKLAGAVLNADAVQLVEAVNRRYEQVNSLTATVEFAASVGGAHKGQQTDYTSIPGYILFRKPEMLRVLGLVPVLHTHRLRPGQQRPDFHSPDSAQEPRDCREQFGDRTGSQSAGEHAPQHLS